MRENVYRVEGDISIPGERKKVMNRCVLRLLDRGGIRKVEETELAGRKFPVAAPPKPDDAGIVRFDYSIFENKKREPAAYDMNTCQLTAPDSGLREYALVMNTIMVMEVIFSDSGCRFMMNDEEFPLHGYVNLAASMTAPEDEGAALKKEDPDTPYVLYKRILRDSEDEFLEFWDMDNLVLSDQMLFRIGEWQEWFRGDGGTEPMQMEEFLAEIICDMYEDWGCRLVDKAFVEEFPAHRDDGNYRKALRLLRSLLDEDLKYFPELTPRQATVWLIRKYRNDHDRIAMSALQSLLVNHRKRQELFGF